MSTVSSRSSIVLMTFSIHIISSVVNTMCSSGNNDNTHGETTSRLAGMTTRGSIHSMSTVSSRSNIAVTTFSIHFISSVVIPVCGIGHNATHGELIAALLA